MNISEINLSGGNLLKLDGGNTSYQEVIQLLTKII
jgi:hypothetical protein